MIYQDEFPEAMRLVAAGTVRTRPLVTHRFGLDAIDEAFAAHRQPDSIKVAVLTRAEPDAVDDRLRGQRP